MWYVVLFTEENTVTVVPNNWYNQEKGECFWPSKDVKQEKVEKFIKQKLVPSDGWHGYSAKILGKYYDYNEAKRKLNKAQETDKLTSTDEKNFEKVKRKPKRNPKYVSSSSDSDVPNSDSDESIIYPPKKPSADATEQPEPELNKHRRTRREHHCIERLPDHLPPTLSVLLEQAVFRHHHIANKEKLEKGLNIGSKIQQKPKKKGGTSIYRTASRSLSPDIFRSSHGSVPSSSRHQKPEIEDAIEHRFSELLDSSENATSSHSSKILGILQKMDADHKEFRYQVTRKLDLLNMKLNDMIENEIRSKNVETNISENNAELLEILGLFPLNDDQLIVVENFLNLKVESCKLLACELSRTGGSSCGEMVRKLMFKLFTNELGQGYSWDGAKRKNKFKHLKIASVILDAVRLNAKTSQATEAEIIACIKKWLVRCKERVLLETKKTRTDESEKK
ncbi:hypothetical protein FQR65_LT16229 [Abscondita terminalis]|nr:hypothetical protein FQR65_LT16229 [Abscondita terminalis]